MQTVTRDVVHHRDTEDTGFFFFYLILFASVYTLTLHKTGINAFARSAELAAITVKILDAGC